MNKSLVSEIKKYEKWEYSPEGIHYKFGGCHGLEKDHEFLFFKALSKLPKEVIDFSQNIFFVSHYPDNFGECFLLRGKAARRYIAIVHLYASLWDRPLKKIVETIAHEIAHAYLKHDWDTFPGDGQREIDADKLTSKWLGRKVLSESQRSLNTSI